MDNKQPWQNIKGHISFLPQKQTKNKTATKNNQNERTK